jgi:hypothetical protein
MVPMHSWFAVPTYLLDVLVLLNQLIELGDHCRGRGFLQPAVAPGAGGVLWALTSALCIQRIENTGNTLRKSSPQRKNNQEKQNLKTAPYTYIHIYKQRENTDSLPKHSKTKRKHKEKKIKTKAKNTTTHR